MHRQTLEATIGALLYGTGKRPDSTINPDAPICRTARRFAGADVPVSGNRLLSVFTHLNGEHPGHVLPAFAKYPDLEELELSEEWISPLLNRLEACLDGVPGAADDISLYDSNKISAAIAACISEYLLATGKTFPADSDFGSEPAFLLYSADFSGIQKFIFTISTDKALASLRSRSFFLELLMEHYIDEMLTACGVSRANLLYSGGGHCYMLLPNTAAVEAAMKRWNLRFNDWLLDEFGSKLFIAQGWTVCCGNDLINIPAAQSPYTAMFRRVSAAIAAHKLHRYSAAQILRINSVEAGEEGRECKVCGRSDKLREDRCFWCDLFITMSRQILNEPAYMVTREKMDSHFALPAAEGEVYFFVTDEKTVRSRCENGGTVVRVYSKNRILEGLSNASRIYVGDYAFSSNMEKLAENGEGITRLAVCRMDVDNLGHAFVAGYRIPDESDPEKRDRYLTIARTSAFSRQMSLFFKHRINAILDVPKPGGEKLSVTIVYSGGDDVFLVGAWNDVITAAQRIQAAFTEFCCGSLTLSAGISLHTDHFPIRQAAVHSAELEDHAKQLPGKNALALFDPEEEHTYNWTVFRQKVVGEKLKVLQAFFQGENQERGNSFLYQLLEFLRQTKADRINLARYAYLLARMEPRERERRDDYRAFSKAMYSWALSAEDRRELITAIYLFVYMRRKKGT